MSYRSLLLLLLLCSLVLQAESCWYPGPGGLRGDGEDEGNIIDDPEGRCTELPGTILPGLDFIPRFNGSYIDGPLWVVNRSTSQGLLGFDADDLPPSSYVPSRDVSAPSDSDDDGTSDSPVVNGIRIESLALGLITAENYDEVMFFDPSNMDTAVDGGLARYLLSVSAPEFETDDYPFLPAPGTAADSRTGISTRACARSGGRTLSEGTAITGDDCAGVGVTSFYTTDTSGATLIGDRLFVSLSNGASIGSVETPIYRPGTVLAFDITDGQEFSPVPDLPVETPSVVFTEGYNPTDVIGYNDGTANYVIVIVSGPIAEVGGRFTRFADSKSYIELIDADSLELLRSVELVLTTSADDHVAALSGVSAIDEVNGYLYVGSAVERSLYSIELATLIAPGADGTKVTWKPLGLPPNGIVLPDTCPGSIRGMAISDDSSEIYAVDYCAGTLVAVATDATGSMATVEDEFALTLPINAPEPDPGDTDVQLKGPTRIAIRPGTPGQNFEGSDLFVLVTQPGGWVCAQVVPSS